MRNTNVTHEMITDVMNLIEKDSYGLKNALREWYGQFQSVRESYDEWLEPKIIYAAQQIQTGEETADAAAIVEALRLNANAGLPWLREHAEIVGGMEGVIEADTNMYVEDGNTNAAVWFGSTSADVAAKAVAVVEAAMKANGFAVEVHQEVFSDEVDTTVFGTRKFGVEVE